MTPEVARARAEARDLAARLRAARSDEAALRDALVVAAPARAQRPEAAGACVAERRAEVNAPRPASPRGDGRGCCAAARQLPHNRVMRLGAVWREAEAAGRAEHAQRLLLATERRSTQRAVTRRRYERERAGDLRHQLLGTERAATDAAARAAVSGDALHARVAALTRRAEEAQAAAEERAQARRAAEQQAADTHHTYAARRDAARAAAELAAARAAHAAELLERRQ
eukprot:gene44788-28505_t